MALRGLGSLPILLASCVAVTKRPLDVPAILLRVLLKWAPKFLVWWAIIMGSVSGFQQMWRNLRRIALSEAINMHLVIAVRAPMSSKKASVRRTAFSS